MRPSVNITLQAVLACGLWAFAIPATGQAGEGAAQNAAGPFAACERPRGHPWTYMELACFDQVGHRHGLLEEARRRLRRLGGGTLEHPWATLVLAHSTFEQHEAQGITLYELAAEGFIRSGEAAGEVVARQNLRNMYRQRGEFEAARRQVERAVAVAEASRDPLLIARGLVIHAGEIIDTGGDIGSAYRALRRAEALAFPGGSIGLRRSILWNLGNAAFYVGRIDESIEAFERHRALRAEDGSLVDAAVVAFNLLNARLTAAENRPVPGARDELTASAQAVLEEVIGLDQDAFEAQARRVLGDLLRSRDPTQAEMHLRRCVDLAAALGHPRVKAACLWSLAAQEATRNPERADQLSREAVALVAGRDSLLLAYAWQSRLRLVWRTLPEDRAIVESLDALDAIERLRASQKDAESRAGLFTGWTRDYYWLTGRLLDVQQPRLAQAFTVGERLRSRVLLEYLAQAGVPQMPDADRAAAGEALARRTAGIQRRLLSSGLDAQERHSLQEQLRLLELERVELDEGRIAAVSPESLQFASIETIQHTLDDRQALLWFSIAPWNDLYDDFGGGAWLVAVTRSAATVHRIAAPVDIDTQVAAFTGLLRDRDAAPAVWLHAARRLGKTLLGEAVAGLPQGIEQLVIVSDGVLHRLPFEALAVDEGSRLLGERFEISLVPSATLWLGLRQSQPSPADARAIVLADPELPPGSPDGDLHLRQLPWARQEAKSIGRLLRLDAGDVLEGRAASERALKQLSFAPFGIVHLAAHARADTAFPERSAVFLTPGDEREDGWLQPREIAQLKLGGRLVVLSACESADGSLLSGEGPLSLARAFFAAGAGAVVATRWPLRDDDAAFVMERFYAGLRDGGHVAAALSRARRDAVAAGLPAGAWAGVTVLGDGFHRPFQAPPSTTRWPLVAGLTVALALALIAGLRRFRVRARPKAG